MPEPVIPMSEEAAETEAHRLIAEAYTPTSYRNDSLPATSTIGTTPPVPQPGIPPMSSKAVDDAVRMLSAGIASLPIGGMTALILHVLGTVDPEQLAIGAAAPTVLVLAVTRLLRRFRDVIPPEIHNHYEGPVYQDQRNVQNKNIGAWVKNTNQP
jgi:hypothetical protein